MPKVISLEQWEEIDQFVTDQKLEQLQAEMQRQAWELVLLGWGLVLLQKLVQVLLLFQGKVDKRKWGEKEQVKIQDLMQTQQVRIHDLLQRQVHLRGRLQDIAHFKLQLRLQVYPQTQERKALIWNVLRLVIPEDWRADVESFRQRQIEAEKPNWFIQLTTMRCLFEFLFAAIQINLENLWLPKKAKGKEYSPKQ